MSGDEIDQNLDYNRISVQNFSYKWTISNFQSVLEQTQDSIRSPAFSIGTNDEWCLRIYPNGVDEESRDYLSVFLEFLTCSMTHLLVKFQVSILNNKGQKIKNMEMPSFFKCKPGHIQGFKKFIFREFLSFEAHWILPDNRLTLLCNVSVAMQDSFMVSEQNRNTGIQVPRCTLADELGELWENSCFTDCCLVVAGQEFQVHKAILAARSPVFSAMFEHDMEESNKNRVEISDLEPQVFRAVMDFIYTGKVPTLHSMADAVLAAADKYGLDHLKLMCEDALCRDLSLENAADTLILADLHSAGQLKTQTLNFITAHACEISKTSKWKTMVDLYPQLVAEAYSYLVLAHSIFLEPISHIVGEILESVQL